MSSKNILTIKKYWNSGADLVTEVSEGFALIDRVKGSVRIVKLIVNRKPDKNSNRLQLFAQLHTKPGYQSLGFPSIVLMRNKYSDDGKFVSFTMYVFSNVAIEKYFWTGDTEELTFICSDYYQFP